MSHGMDDLYEPYRIYFRCCYLLIFMVIFYAGNDIYRYYAAPSMHHAILQEASVRYHATETLTGEKTPPPTESVRFVANAAGGLVSFIKHLLVIYH